MSGVIEKLILADIIDFSITPDILTTYMSSRDSYCSYLPFGYT